MTLLQRLRNLRTDPFVMAWVNDSDVMWLPGYSDGRIIVPFCEMKKEDGFFRLTMTGSSVELSSSDLRLVKMERPCDFKTEAAAFLISESDCSECRELMLEYYGLMDEYLRNGDACTQADLEKCEVRIEKLLRRIQI